MKIVVDTCEFPASMERVRVYHTRSEIECTTRESGLIVISDDSNYCCSLTDRFKQIPGVTRASHSQFYVTIVRGGAFDWDELQPGIIEVLKDLLKLNPQDHLDVDTHEVDAETMMLYR